MNTKQLPPTGFLRLKQILGDPKADPPTPALIPISNSAWWDGIKKGLYPRPVKLSVRTSAWRVEEIKDLIDSLSSEGAK